MRNKILKLVLGALLLGFTNASYAGYCDRGSKVVPLGAIIHQTINDGISEKYYLKAGDRSIRDLMSLTIVNMGRFPRLPNSCLKVRFIYGLNSLTYQSGGIRQVSPNLRKMRGCVANAKRRGFVVLKEAILPPRGQYNQPSAYREIGVMYLFDKRSKTAYPFWIGGKDMFLPRGRATSRTRLMSDAAARKCEQGLEKATNLRDQVLHREILREAPANYPSPRRRPGSFQSRPPVGVPPMLPPVLLY